jgi:hypothetical protein
MTFLLPVCHSFLKLTRESRLTVIIFYLGKKTNSFLFKQKTNSFLFKQKTNSFLIRPKKQIHFYLGQKNKKMSLVHVN